MAFSRSQYRTILAVLAFMEEWDEGRRLLSMLRADSGDDETIKFPAKDKIDPERLVVDLLADTADDEPARNDLALIGFELLEFIGAGLDATRLLELVASDATRLALSRNIARFVATPGQPPTDAWLAQTARTLPQFERFFGSEQGAIDRIEETWKQARNAPGSHHSPMTVIVHGTKAANEDWWRPGVGGKKTFADFVAQESNWPLEKSYPGWSGGMRHRHRRKAASDLAAWLRQQTYSEVRIIAHSHGGNVAILASQTVPIDHLILLGTPIALEYVPVMKIIQRLDNVYSFSDFWQMLGSRPLHRRGEGRSVTDSLSYVNREADDNGAGVRPNHSELHEEQSWRSSRLLGLIQ